MVSSFIDVIFPDGLKDAIPKLPEDGTPPVEGLTSAVTHWRNTDDLLKWDCTLGMLVANHPASSLDIVEMTSLGEALLVGL